MLNTAEVPNLYASEDKAEIAELVRTSYAAQNTTQGDASLV